MARPRSITQGPQAVSRSSSRWAGRLFPAVLTSWLSATLVPDLAGSGVESVQSPYVATQGPALPWLICDSLLSGAELENVPPSGWEQGSVSACSTRLFTVLLFVNLTQQTPAKEASFQVWFCGFLLSWPRWAEFSSPVSAGSWPLQNQQSSLSREIFLHYFTVSDHWSSLPSYCGWPGLFS